MQFFRKGRRILVETEFSMVSKKVFSDQVFSSFVSCEERSRLHKKIKIAQLHKRISSRPGKNSGVKILSKREMQL
jgi:hypothetical protein